MTADGRPRLQQRLADLYFPQRCPDRVESIRRMVEMHESFYGPAEALSIVRAPGKLNTLGKHADHRGAYTNPVSLEWEMLLAFSPRADDRFVFRNAEAEFGCRDFRLAELLPPKPLADLDDWLDWTGGQANARLAAGTRNDWGHKLSAIPVYIQAMLSPGVPLRGMDAVLGGDVPRAVGLSSSSAVVIAVMEAVVAANELELDDEGIVLHAGRAEWYVGTRGGFGDHAGIKFGRLDRITHLRSEPALAVKDHLPFSPAHRFLVFHSGFEADKTGEAGQRFNEKTASYALGELYMRRWLAARHQALFEQLWNARADLPEHKRIYLGDLVERLEADELFALLAEVPPQRTRARLRAEWPAQRTLLERLFGSHEEPADGYGLRRVMTYGLSEVARCQRAEGMLQSGDLPGYGELMNASHDGDRVSNIDPDTAALKAEPDRSVPLWRNPGDYACSTPQLDEMCDLALEVGALGAQLSGAGCGGSMMALLPADAADELIDQMTRRYYAPRNLPPRHWTVRPATGSGVI
jgi:galactokinase